jgi:hypothetical protein
MIVEADDIALLSKGMRSFAIRVARRVNREVLGRARGKVWADRHHRHNLASPRELLGLHSLAPALRLLRGHEPPYALANVHL